MGLLKWVLVKITIFTSIRKALDLKKYIDKCVATGSASVLYAHPHINTTYYTSGTNEGIAIDTAVTNWGLAPTKANLKIIKDKMALGKLWLEGYANQVVPIANDPANCSTREEAATNIATSYLTPQKITVNKKGKPATPTFTVTTAKGSGNADIVVTNIGDFNPTLIVFIAVEIPTDPEKVIAPAAVSIPLGQLIITCDVAVMVSTISMPGKGKNAQFKQMKTGRNYNVYSYCIQGKMKISDLSDPVLLTM